MRSHTFLAGAVTGVVLVLLVSGLLLAGLGRQPTSAASGTPETGSAKTAATPGDTTGLSKAEINDVEQRMINIVSDAEWNAAATTLGMSSSDFEAAITGGKSVAALGAPHNVTTEQVRTAMVAAGSTAVSAALQRGTITQPGADTLNNGLVAAIADKVTHANSEETASAASGTPTVDEKTLDAQKQAVASPAAAANDNIANAELSAMASTLGVSAEELKTTLSVSGGATLAAAHHVTAQQLNDAMVAAGQQALG
jgi:hypothetical protein